jgi:hypothetical protein
LGQTRILDDSLSMPPSGFTFAWPGGPDHEDVRRIDRAQLIRALGYTSDPPHVDAIWKDWLSWTATLPGGGPIALSGYIANLVATEYARPRQDAIDRADLLRLEAAGDTERLLPDSLPARSNRPRMGPHTVPQRQLDPIEDAPTEVADVRARATGAPKSSRQRTRSTSWPA